MTVHSLRHQILGSLTTEGTGIRLLFCPREYLGLVQERGPRAPGRGDGAGLSHRVPGPNQDRPSSARRFHWATTTTTGHRHRQRGLQEALRWGVGGGSCGPTWLSSPSARGKCARRGPLPCAASQGLTGGRWSGDHKWMTLKSGPPRAYLQVHTRAGGPAPRQAGVLGRPLRPAQRSLQRS